MSAPEDTTERVGSGETVYALLVEDNPGDAKIIENALRGTDVRLDHVESLAAAKAHLATSRVDVLLLDLQLPDSHGLDTMVTLLARARDLAVIVLTGWGDDELALEALREGAQDYLQKGSFDDSILLRSIRYSRERRLLSTTLRQSEERFRKIVETSQEGILTVDRDWRVTYANDWIGRILSYRAEELLGHDVFELVSPEAHAVLAAYLRDGVSGVHPREISLLGGDGREVPVLLSTGPLSCDGDFEGSVCTLTDMTEYKIYERELRRLALSDVLTGLANWTLFEHSVNRALKKSRRSGYHVAVLQIDLDGLRMVNEALGHRGGDELLRAYGDRLAACLRESDVVARLGEDNFAVLLEDLPGPEYVHETVKRLCDVVDEPIEVSDTPVHMKSSIGVAVTSGSATVDKLLKQSDAALWRAKEVQGTSYCVYDRGSDGGARKRLEYENELRRAIEGGELYLEYQPIVTLREGNLCGAEALVRWRHPDRGELPPNDFIPLAEESGLIQCIDLWVLRTACLHLRSWLDRAPLRDDFKLSVNLSAQSLRDPRLPEAISASLLESRIEAPRLQLEITEAAAVHALAHTDDIRALGVTIALDDLGTGYSSLEYLTRLEVDAVKIDTSFVGRLTTRREARAVVEAVVLLADRLDLETTAEGIETAEQLEILQGFGCTLGQGFYFSSSLGVEVIDDLLYGGRAQEV